MSLELRELESWREGRVWVLEDGNEWRSRHFTANSDAMLLESLQVQVKHWLTWKHGEQHAHEVWQREGDALVHGVRVVELEM